MPLTLYYNENFRLSSYTYFRLWICPQITFTIVLLVYPYSGITVMMHSLVYSRIFISLKFGKDIIAKLK